MLHQRPLIDFVIGTRPNIVKAGPLLARLRNVDWCRPRVVFLAQHTTDAMTTQMLEDLEIGPAEIHHIRIETSGMGRRMGEMIERYATHLLSTPPRLVVVFGDVDSTFAAAFAAKRVHIPVAHVEAGLRSGDLTMPEELNRRMVDSISDVLLTTTRTAVETLLREDRDARDIHFTGNLMIDALKRTLGRSDFKKASREVLAEHGLTSGKYAVATFHRPSNVDSAEHLRRIAGLLEVTAAKLPVVFPVHPRSRAALQRHGLQVDDRVKLVPPLRYLKFIALLSGARVALTDSGGLQEETSVLGIPCLTFRNNTERPETISLGTNRLVQPEDASAMIDMVLSSPMPAPAEIPLWDGDAATRIARSLQTWLKGCPITDRGRH